MDGLVLVGDGQLALDRHRVGAIKLALQASLQTSGASGEVHRLLQMIVAFDKELDAPDIAETLRTILRSDPDGLALLREHFVPDPIAEARRFAAELRRVLGPHRPNVDGGAVSDGFAIEPSSLMALDAEERRSSVDD